VIGAAFVREVHEAAARPDGARLVAVPTDPGRSRRPRRRRRTDLRRRGSCGCRRSGPRTSRIAAPSRRRCSPRTARRRSRLASRRRGRRCRSRRSRMRASCRPTRSPARTDRPPPSSRTGAPSLAADPAPSSRAASCRRRWIPRTGAVRRGCHMGEAAMLDWVENADVDPGSAMRRGAAVRACRRRRRPVEVHGALVRVELEGEPPPVRRPGGIVRVPAAPTSTVAALALAPARIAARNAPRTQRLRAAGEIAYATVAQPYVRAPS
jgi:hypothetical protein